MRAVKNILSQLHTFVLWLLASAIFWGWIFTFVTDTSVEKKITVYCEVPQMEDRLLAAALEEDMPEGLRMIKVHPFSYVMFDMESIGKGDIFIIPAADREELDLLGDVQRDIAGHPEQYRVRLKTVEWYEEARDWLRELFVKE